MYVKTNNENRSRNKLIVKYLERGRVRKAPTNPSLSPGPEKGAVEREEPDIKTIVGILCFVGTHPFSPVL